MYDFGEKIEFDKTEKIISPTTCTELQELLQQTKAFYRRYPKGRVLIEVKESEAGEHLEFTFVEEDQSVTVAAPLSKYKRVQKI